MYPEDYHDPEKRGKRFKPDGNEMVVMNDNGIFFIYNGQDYYPFIRELSSELKKYDVVWK